MDGERGMLGLCSVERICSLARTRGLPSEKVMDDGQHISYSYMRPRKDKYRGHQLLFLVVQLVIGGRKGNPFWCI